MASVGSSLGLKTVKPFTVAASSQTWLVDRAGQLLVFKAWKPAAGAPTAGAAETPYPVIAHRLLASMHVAYDRLVLPQYLYDGYDERVGWYVVLTYIEGRDFRDRWHYFKPDRQGGLKLEPANIDLALDLMADLRRVPGGDLVEEGLKTITQPFAVRGALRRLRKMCDVGLVLPVQAAALEEALSSLASFDDPRRPLTVSNGGFRFLDLLEISPDRTAIIDWGGAQSSTFEIENGLAYNWLFLWNRPDLQERLLRGAEERLGLDRDVFRSVLLIRAVMQAQMCERHPDQLLLHVQQAMGVLNDPGFPFS